MPGVDGLKDITPFVREFGPILCVLFILLLFLLSLVSYIVLRQAKLLEELRETMTVHHAGMLTAAQEIKLISATLQSFRDSERDLLANLRETISTHATACANGHDRMREMARDVDAIGGGVSKLLAILTMKRRQNGDDTAGQG